jgi:hypothetical protein
VRPRDIENAYLAFDPSDEAPIHALLGHSIAYRIATGLREGQKVFMLRTLPAERGQVRYALKTPYRDGTTHVIFEPEDFIARLAALVPKPRAHLIRFHGVFAPSSGLRAAVVPSGRGRGSGKGKGGGKGSGAEASEAPVTERTERHHALTWAVSKDPPIEGSGAAGPGTAAGDAVDLNRWVREKCPCDADATGGFALGRRSRCRRSPFLDGTERFGSEDGG